jgi:serine/threonine protein kinase
LQTLKTGEPPLHFDNSAGPTAPPAFGAYRVLHQIGSGVLGPVFRTYDPQHDRVVVVKAFRLDVPPEEIAHLANALRRLAVTDTAPCGVVHAFEAGIEGTLAYLASDYVAAETFDVALRQLAPMPLDRALPIVVEIADALDAAADRGMLHGALHPRDVFITSGGKDALVAGCGIVQALESVGLKAPLRRPYTAPERAAGERWDRRADVYSLGALAHELLTRRRPAGPGEQDGVLAAGVSAEQRVQVRRVLSQALAERPEDRYPTAQAFADALAAVALGDSFADPHVEILELASAAAPPLSQHAAQESSKNDERRADLSALDEFVVAETASVVETGPVAEPTPVALPLAPPVAPADTPVARADTPVAREPERPRVPQPVAAFSDASEIEPAPMLATGAAGAAPGHEAKTIDPPIVDPPIHDDPPVVVSPPVERPRASSTFPWSAVAAVAAAGIAIGVVAEYQYLRRPVSPASSTAAPSQPAIAETEVQVPPAPAPPAATVPSSSPTARATAPPVAPAPSAPTQAARVTREASDSRGRLVVRSTPSGAMVRVDGRPRGQTPATVTDVALGRHTLEVARSGYVPHTETVMLSPRSPARALSVALRPGLTVPGATSAGQGSMFVDSRPQRARILIDGQFVGETPLRVSELSGGRHAVRLELSGYRPFATTVGITAGQQAWVTASLEERRD